VLYCVEGVASDRSAWYVPITTHSSFLLDLCKTKPVGLLDLFHNHMLKFIYRLLRSQTSVVVCLLAAVCCVVCGSERGQYYSCRRYKTSIDNIFNCDFNMNKIDRISADTIQ